ncbi:MAG: mechanosensitive ion channel family protein [Vicinamibacterales bacterium]
MHVRVLPRLLPALAFAVLALSSVPRAGAQPATAPAEATAPALLADATVRDRLRAAYDTVEGLAEVQVRVRGGVVRLDGSVESSTAAERAVAIARAMPGVVFVDEELAVRNQVGPRVTPLVARARAWGARVVSGLPLLALALVIVAVFFAFARLVTRSHGLFARAVPNPLVRQFMQRLVAAAVGLAGVVLALQLLDWTTVVGAVAGTAGLAGIALGFAFRDLAENYLAGILLAIQQPFGVNDHVRVVDLEGRVIRMTGRDTVLMTLDGNHLRVPNATVFKEVMTNYTRNPLRRLDFAVGVGVLEQLTHVQQIGTTRLARVPGVVASPPAFSRVENLADSSVTVRFFAWVDQREKDFAKVRSEAIRQTKSALDKAGISMPQPGYTVTLERPVPPGAGPARATAVEEPPAHEVGVDHYLEAQIAADRQATDESDLLEPPPPPAPGGRRP